MLFSIRRCKELKTKTLPHSDVSKANDYPKKTVFIQL